MPLLRTSISRNGQEDKCFSIIWTQISYNKYRQKNPVVRKTSISRIDLNHSLTDNSFTRGPLRKSPILLSPPFFPLVSPRYSCKGARGGHQYYRKSRVGIINRLEARKIRREMAEEGEVEASSSPPITRPFEIFEALPTSGGNHLPNWCWPATRSPRATRELLLSIFLAIPLFRHSNAAWTYLLYGRPWPPRHTLLVTAS